MQVAENELNSMESFKVKISQAINGNNKGEDIRNAIMDLLRSCGVQIPDIVSKSGGMNPKRSEKK